MHLFRWLSRRLFQLLVLLHQILQENREMKEAIAALTTEIAALTATVDSAIAAGIGPTPEDPATISAITDATASLKTIADKLAAALPPAPQA